MAVAVASVALCFLVLFTQTTSAALQTASEGILVHTNSQTISPLLPNALRGDSASALSLPLTRGSARKLLDTTSGILTFASASADACKLLAQCSSTLKYSVNGTNLLLTPTNVPATADCEGADQQSVNLAFSGPVATATSATFTQDEGTETLTGGSGTVVANLTFSADGTTSSCTATYNIQNGTILGSSAGGSNCFPASATVTTPAGQKLMKHLQLGDEVLVGGPAIAPRFERVFMWSHRDNSAKAAFFEIQTASGAVLRMTGGHYLWVDAQLKRAGDVAVGDLIYTLDKAGNSLAPTPVTAVTTKVLDGLFNPHTKSGSIIIDGVAASTFTDVLPPSVAAHTVITLPGQVLYNLLPSVVASALNDAILKVVFGQFNLQAVLLQLSSMMQVAK